MLEHNGFPQIVKLWLGPSLLKTFHSSWMSFALRELVKILILSHTYILHTHYRNENFVNSLLLSTLIDSSVDFRHRIMQEPIAISFTPTPLVCFIA